MRIIVHAGPHKTGTTAIQDFLASNRATLRSVGVHYPKFIPGRTGQHNVPWSIKGWNLRLLGAEHEHELPRAILDNYLGEARTLGAHTLLLSSEDFSLLTAEEWQEFFRCLSDALDAQSMEAEVCVTWSKRSTRQLARASYSTLVLMGLALEFDEVRRPLQAHFRSFYRNIVRFATSPTLRISRRPVHWRRRGFLHAWMTDVVSVHSGTALKFSRSPVNQSLSMNRLRRLARDNGTRGVVFDTDALWSWPDYHDETSIQNQRRARADLLGRGS
jgi:hypothetical protein